MTIVKMRSSLIIIMTALLLVAAPGFWIGTADGWECMMMIHDNDIASINHIFN